jgi:hypothetical protein
MTQLNNAEGVRLEGAALRMTQLNNAEGVG